MRSAMFLIAGVRALRLHATGRTGWWPAVTGLLVCLVAVFSCANADARPSDIDGDQSDVAQHGTWIGAQVASDSRDLDFQRYAPMPMPEPAVRSQRAVEPSNPPPSGRVSYDPRSGQEVLHPTTESTATASGEVGGGGGGDPMAGEEPGFPGVGFGNEQLVAEPELFPWRANVKVFFRQAGGDFFCSGMLIDPRHVLTAGHCVHAGPGGTWSEDVFVVPAYADGHAPFGMASGIELHAWNGWIEQELFDHDVGVVVLDRPIGALTGWVGYGFEDDCAFYTTNVFHNLGYPAEPQLSGFDGEHLRYRFGSFDGTDCEGTAWERGEQVYINRPSWGGASGGGHYLVGPSRVAYAVVSNSNRGTCTAGVNCFTGNARITREKFTDIRDALIGAATPATFDLLPLDVRISPETIAPGTPLESMDYMVHNYASASFAGLVDVTIVVWADDDPATAVPIHRHSFVTDLAPKASVRVAIGPPPAIPASLPAGRYRIGVAIETVDANAFNNVSTGEDVDVIELISVCGDGILQAGEECDDGNTTGGDCCSPLCGSEVVGSPCGVDGNICTDDVCDGAGRCIHPNNGRACNDGLFCNGADVCVDGRCDGHAGDPCDDGLSCTADHCDEALRQCRHVPDDARCADGNPCTADRCVSGAGATGCAHTLLIGQRCEDDLFCTVGGVCDGAGHCVGGTVRDCSALTDHCNDGVCDEGMRACRGIAVTDGQACDDGLSCTREDVCHAGVCEGQAVDTDCDDSDPCTIDRCDAATTACTYAAVDFGSLSATILPASTTDVPPGCDPTNRGVKRMVRLLRRAHRAIERAQASTLPKMRRLLVRGGRRLRKVQAKAERSYGRGTISPQCFDEFIRRSSDGRERLSCVP